MRKLLAVATLSVAPIVGVAGAMGPAGAAEAATTATGIIKQPTSAYTSPSKTTATVQLLDQGDTVDVLCYTEGQRVNDNPYWFRISTGPNSGYVHRDAIAPSTTDLPHC
jgi:hypothetical protein